MGDENLKAASGYPVEVGQRRKWQKKADRFQREFVVKRVVGDDVTIVYDNGREEPYTVGSMGYAPLCPGLAAPAATKEPERRVGQRYRVDDGDFVLTTPDGDVDWHIKWLGPHAGITGLITAGNFAEWGATLISEPEHADIDEEEYQKPVNKPKAPRELTWEGITALPPHERAKLLNGHWQAKYLTADMSAAAPTVAPKATNSTYTQCAHCSRIFPGTPHADVAEKLREHLVAVHGAPAVAAPAAPKLCGMVCTNPVSHPDSPLCEKHIYQAMLARDEAMRAGKGETGRSDELMQRHSHLLGSGCLGVWAMRAPK
jgi:hypothetical protein